MVRWVFSGASDPLIQAPAVMALFVALFVALFMCRHAFIRIENAKGVLPQISAARRLCLGIGIVVDAYASLYKQEKCQLRRYGDFW